MKNKHQGSSFQSYLAEQPTVDNEGPDGNVHCMPKSGPEHTESVDCWCEPEVIQDSSNEGGCKAYLHKEVQ